MKLILVRHGETKANIEKIMQGHLPGELTEKGKEQAKKVGGRLKNEKIDLIVVSDLKRAVDTAKPIIKNHPESKVIFEERIRERNLGVFEGKPYGSFSEAAEKAGMPVEKFKPERGESIEESYARAKEFFDELINREKGRTVAVISHGGFLTNALIYLLRKSREEYLDLHPKNTALTILEIKDDRNHEVIRLNCVEHLE